MLHGELFWYVRVCIFVLMPSGSSGADLQPLIKPEALVYLIKASSADDSLQKPVKAEARELHVRQLERRGEGILH